MEYDLTTPLYTYNAEYARQLFDQLRPGDLLKRNNVFHGRCDTNPDFYNLPTCAIVVDTKLYQMKTVSGGLYAYPECVRQDELTKLPCTCTACHRRFVNTIITAVGRNDKNTDVLHEFYGGMLGYYIIGGTSVGMR